MKAINPNTNLISKKVSTIVEANFEVSEVSKDIEMFPYKFETNEGTIYLGFFTDYYRTESHFAGWIVMCICVQNDVITKGYYYYHKDAEAETFGFLFKEDKLPLEEFIRYLQIPIASGILWADSFLWERTCGDEESAFDIKYDASSLGNHYEEDRICFDTDVIGHMGLAILNETQKLFIEHYFNIKLNY